MAGRWLRPCSSCGQAVAETDKSILYYDNGRDQDPTETHRLCASCANKRKSIQQFYTTIKPRKGSYEAINKAQLQNSQYSNYVLSAFVEKFEANKILLPQDINQIGEKSKPRNYIGFIYADGNRMGEVIKSMDAKYPNDQDAKNAYKAFSSIVDESTREAATQAVYEHVAYVDKEKSICTLPAEFVLAGGDDLILIVPAHHALAVTCRFIQLFNHYTREKQQKLCTDKALSECFEPDGLTTSAGVVIAHASYPASQLMDLAADLMKSAKRKAAKLATPEGTLDFMVLHDSGSESIKYRRKKEYTRTSGELKVDLTERPYTATEAVALVDRIRQLKKEGVPRTKLKQLYPILFQDLLPAQFNAQRIRERLMKTGDLADESSMQALMKELDCFPFRSATENQENHWSTYLTELIELYDFVQTEGEPDGQSA